MRNSKFPLDQPQLFAMRNRLPLLDFKGIPFLLWMDEIHFAPSRNHRKPLVVGIYKGIMIPGFLRWCRNLSIHRVSFLGK